MTLYRQLVIFTFVLFLILFIGTWFAKLETTRSFLVDQLESHAQDTATALGLSITQFVIEKDMPIIESMINAVSDHGYYSVVRLTDARDEVLIERALDVTIENVPSWFIRMVPLETPDGSAGVMSGWSRAGSVYVKSHPGYAYKTLWEDMVRTTVWFLICGIFVLIAGGFGLRFLLRPLLLAERQADAICRKEYEIQERVPWTRELKLVVEAMNRMTRRVKEMFDEQVMQAEGLRERAYHDTVTGLGNRRYFDSQLKARFDDSDGPAKGILLLVRLNDLDRLNQQKGLQAGDAFLKKSAEVLENATSQYGTRVIARLTGGDFGIFLQDAPSWDAETIAAALAAEMEGLGVEGIAVTENIGHVGAAAYEAAVTQSRLLSEADRALAAAREKGPNQWSVVFITEETEKMPLGRQQWKTTLEKALKDRRITLDAQPVVMAANRNQLLHLEVFSRIILANGKLLSANEFMPLAARMDLVSSIDQMAIEEVLELKVRNIAVNLSFTSLQDEEFREWLDYTLKNLPLTAPRVSFEFSEFSAVQNLEAVRDFGIFVREYGHSIGLDHYGQSFTNLAYLKSMRPDYVKIDRAYTGELKNSESDSRLFIGSLCSVAHSIDIMVIAGGVESEEQFQVLRELKVDAIQGYVVDHPKPIQEILR